MYFIRYRKHNASPSQIHTFRSLQRNDICLFFGFHEIHKYVIWVKFTFSSVKVDIRMF